MRTIAAPALAALQSSSVALVLLVEMDLSTPLFMNSTGMTLSISGNTYIGTAGLGHVDVVQDTPAEIKQLSFTLSGVPSGMVALALSEPVQGKAVRIKVAVLDNSTMATLGVYSRWSGRLDTMMLDDGQGSGAITVTAEHAAIDLVRPYTSYFNDLEQRRLYPGDLALQFVNDQAEMQVVWPAASWGKK